MTSMINYFRSFAMIILCLNFAMNRASEHNYFPVPQLYGASAGMVSFNNDWNTNFLLSQKRQIITIATAIIVVSIVYYMYKQNTAKKVKDAALDEMHSYIDNLEKKMSACIDKFPGCPVIVKKYLKETISKSIAEHIANIRNSSIRYIKKNKKYFISLTAAPVGMWLSYPVTGGAVAMLGVVYGAIQSAREEIAEFRKETEKLFAETNQNIKKGFENSEQNAENNKNELIEKIEQEVQGVSKNIEGISNQIHQLQDNLGEKIEGTSNKVEKLSTELGTITSQIVLLHNKVDVRDQKDVERDEKANKLLAIVEEASNKLASVQKEFVGLIENLIEKSDEKAKKEFDRINKLIVDIDGKQTDQTKSLLKVQNQIGTLLDKNETTGKTLTQLLDTIQSSNASLEEIKIKANTQDNAMQNIQAVLEKVQKKIHENHDALLMSVSEAVKQCSNLSSRVTSLENKVDGHDKSMQLLLQQNKKLEERVDKLLLVIEDLKNNNQKDNKILREEFQKTATQMGNQLNTLVDFTQKYDNQKRQLTDGSSNIDNKKKKHPVYLHDQGTSMSTLKQQLLSLQTGKS